MSVCGFVFDDGKVCGQPTGHGGPHVIWGLKPADDSSAADQAYQNRRIEFVMHRLHRVVTRLDVAFHETEGVASARQVMHAVDSAHNGLDVEMADAAALVDALLPYIDVAGKQVDR